MSAVWQESSAQAREMLHAFTGRHDQNGAISYGKGETNSVVEGVRTIAINVIASIAYGDRRSWTQTTSDVGTPPAGFDLSFMEAVLAIVNNHIVSVFVSANILTLSFMPKVLRTLGAATVDFPKYAKGFIVEERQSPGTRNSLIGALVKIADGQKSQTPRPSKSSSNLSEDEITGNLFNFTIAGFDTTASTMAYALMALAIQPQWQDWIAEEIDRAARLAQAENYERSFPLLTRCLALMVCKPFQRNISVFDSPGYHSSTRLFVFTPQSSTSPAALQLPNLFPTLFPPTQQYSSPLHRSTFRRRCMDPIPFLFAQLDGSPRHTLSRVRIPLSNPREERFYRGQGGLAIVPGRKWRRWNS